MKELIKTTVRTPDGVFTLTHTKDWEPMGSIGISRRRSDGVILWFMHKPLGTLIKYPCGAKRYLPEHTAPDLKTIYKMV